ncbi:MAG: hypothetical protein JNL58_31625 [Planctomyces sp.]|nr:hypothetical protein [Planctomyces sp.]
MKRIRTLSSLYKFNGEPEASVMFNGEPEASVMFSGKPEASVRSCNAQASVHCSDNTTPWLNDQNAIMELT